VENAALLRNSGLIESTGSGNLPIFPLGVYLEGGTLLNYGTIEAQGGGVGVNIVGGGTVVNHGVIADGVGGNIGEMVDFGNFLVSNSGIIEGSNYFFESGTFANTGTVTDGINLRVGGEITNSGTLNGVEGYGITLSNSGTVTGGVETTGFAGQPGTSTISNAHNGVISGSTGIYMYQGTVINAGTIIGTGGVAVDFTGEAGGLVVDDPGSVFEGKVEVSGSVGGELELASGTGIGTLAGADQQFSGFTSVAVEHGAEWNIAGQTTAYAGIEVSNNGTVTENSSDKLTIDGNVRGNGVTILDSTTLVLNGSVSSGQEISFEGGKDQLSLGDPSQFSGTITQFGPDDTIDLTGVARNKITGEHFAGGVLTLTEATGSITLAFADPSTFASGFSLSAAGSGTDITLAKVQPAVLGSNADLTFLGGTSVEELAAGSPAWLPAGIITLSPGSFILAPYENITFNTSLSASGGVPPIVNTGILHGPLPIITLAAGNSINLASLTSADFTAARLSYFP